MWEEHYLPEGLGRFRNFEPLYDKVCSGRFEEGKEGCNNRIGLCETQFLRTGPIGFLRERLDIRGKDGRRPSAFYERAAGAPAVEILAPPPHLNYDILWEFLPPGTVNLEPLRQIVFRDSAGATHPVAITKAMATPQSLAEALIRKGLKDAVPINAFVTSQEEHWIENLWTGLWPERSIEWETISWSPQRRTLTARVVVTSLFFRAVAKIGFHYTLKQFPDLTGNESQFSSIRSYIRDGLPSPQPIVQETDSSYIKNLKNSHFKTWTHVLSVYRDYERILARCTFFSGPLANGLSFEIDVGRNPARLHYREQRVATIYVYDDPLPKSNPVGETVPIDVVQNLVIPN